MIVSLHTAGGSGYRYHSTRWLGSVRLCFFYSDLGHVLGLFSFGGAKPSAGILLGLSLLPNLSPLLRFESDPTKNVLDIRIDSNDCRIFRLIVGASSASCSGKCSMYDSVERDIFCL